MLSPANGEQIHLVNYVEDYLDSIESLPFDLQRNVSLMREIDAKYQEILKELDDYYEKFKRETDGTQKRRVLHCIQRALIRSQELGDEKIQIVSQMVELVENRSRQVDSHVELFEAHQDISDGTGGSGKAGQDKSKSEAITQADKPNNKRSRRQRNNENRENASNNHDHDDITSGTPKEKKAKSTRRWMVEEPNPSVSAPPARDGLTPQGPLLIHVTLRTSSLRGRTSRRQFPNKDLFCNEAELGRGHRSSLAPLPWATLVTEHRYWLNVSDHSS